MRVIAVAIIAALLVIPAMAAEAPSTTVNVGWFASFLSEYVLPSVSALAGGVLAFLANMLKQKWNLDIDASQRAALQAAVTNAAGLLIVRGVGSLDGKTIDVGNPLLAAGIKYVQDAVPGALKHFGLGPEDIAQKIAAKLPMFAQGIPAAGAPAVVPVVVAAPA